MNPKLSIIIPTRNKSQELVIAVESAVMLADRLTTEIIVVSNGESLESDIAGLSRQTIEKLRIVRSPTRLSLTQNWKFGLNLASGEWVHFLGDDDFITLSANFNLSKLLDEVSTNGIKFKISHFDWSMGIPEPGTAKGSLETFQWESCDIEQLWGEKWWKIRPNFFPTGAAHSLVRNDWLRKYGEKNALNSTSPDWYTGAMFALSETQFVKVDAYWAAIGKHPNSSVSQMKNPKSALTGIEVAMSANDGNSELRERYGGMFPTTWLAKADALLQARMVCKSASNSLEKELIRESYNTTPRFVFKVYRVQKKKAKEFSWRHHYWLIRYTIIAICKYLKASV